MGGKPGLFRCKKGCRRCGVADRDLSRLVPGQRRGAGFADNRSGDLQGRAKAPVSVPAFEARMPACETDLPQQWAEMRDQVDPLSARLRRMSPSCATDAIRIPLRL